MKLLIQISKEDKNNNLVEQLCDTYDVDVADENTIDFFIEEFMRINFGVDKCDAGINSIDSNWSDEEWLTEENDYFVYIEVDGKRIK